MNKKHEISKLDRILEDSPNDILDNIQSEDIVFPRMCLMQAMSGLVSAGEAKPGQIVLNIDGHHYSEPGEAVDFIPLFYWHSRIMFAPLDSGGGVLCKAENGKLGIGNPGGDCLSCQYKEWASSDSGKQVAPDCNRVHNFAVLCPNESGEHRVSILPLSKTSFRVGTTLLNRMRVLKGPSYAYCFRLSTAMADGAKYKYWTYSLAKWDDSNRIDKRIDSLSNWEDLFDECKAAADTFKDAYKEGTIDESPSSIEDEVPF